jgi:hypothetical protein
LICDLPKCKQAFAATLDTHEVSFNAMSHGAPLHTTNMHWKVMQAQQSVKEALLKEEESARARVEAAKKAASATRKAEHLAEEEVQRLNRLEEIQKGLQQSQRTNNIETKIQRSKHAAYSTHADAPVQQMASFGGGTVISPDAVGAERAKQPLHVQPVQVLLSLLCVFVECVLVHDCARVFVFDSPFRSSSLSLSVCLLLSISRARMLFLYISLLLSLSLIHTCTGGAKLNR